MKINIAFFTGENVRSRGLRKKSFPENLASQLYDHQRYIGVGKKPWLVICQSKIWPNDCSFQTWRLFFMQKDEMLKNKVHKANDASS